MTFKLTGSFAVNATKRLAYLPMGLRDGAAHGRRIASESVTRARDFAQEYVQRGAKHGIDVPRPAEVALRISAGVGLAGYGMYCAHKAIALDSEVSHRLSLSTSENDQPHVSSDIAESSHFTVGAFKDIRSSALSMGLGVVLTAPVYNGIMRVQASGMPWSQALFKSHPYPAFFLTMALSVGLRSSDVFVRHGSFSLFNHSNYPDLSSPLLSQVNSMFAIVVSRGLVSGLESAKVRAAKSGLRTVPALRTITLSNYFVGARAAMKAAAVSAVPWWVMYDVIQGVMGPKEEWTKKQHLFAALLISSVAETVSSPFKVVRVRQSVEGDLCMWRTMFGIIQREGVKPLFAALPMRIVLATVCNALTIYVWARLNKMDMVEELKGLGSTLTRDFPQESDDLDANIDAESPFT